MKKTVLYSAVAIASLVAVTGCLKDKDFEDQKYGIQVNDTKPAVAFAQEASGVNVGITSAATPVVIAGPALTIEGQRTATVDVPVTIVADESVVTAARAAGRAEGSGDSALAILPAGTYTLSNMSPVIRKDSGFVNNLTISITNTQALNPDSTYAIGYRITNVGGGYQVAENSRTVLVRINIKNKYDGVYQLTGYHNRTPYTFRYNTEMHMITQGPASVYFYWPEVNSKGHPIGVGPNNSLSWYGAAISPIVTFNTTTDLVTDVRNLDASVPITMFTGAGAGVSRFRDNPGTTNDTMFVYWNYNNNPLRAFFDTLVYKSPRP
ncbi:DUF1735 domain-containing protein [Flaviaesturariibacter amylovorans]|uniref:BT-3987-like N-terminal domain-containing protein n=1 Tax=Flaviaesturariibacter amylovorans TaxID=1084520 RepID=A0ABP8G978_9BACT